MGNRVLCYEIIFCDITGIKVILKFPSETIFRWASDMTKNIGGGTIDWCNIFPIILHLSFLWYPRWYPRMFLLLFESFSTFSFLFQIWLNDFLIFLWGFLWGNTSFILAKIIYSENFWFSKRRNIGSFHFFLKFRPNDFPGFMWVCYRVIMAWFWKKIPSFDSSKIFNNWPKRPKIGFFRVFLKVASNDFEVDNSNIV